jgi:hypothetical protein
MGMLYNHIGENSMRYNQTNTPKTVTLLSATFTLSEQLLSYIESLNLAGPEGKWAEARVGEGNLRVYGPDNFTPGVTVLGRISIHTNPAGREYKRVILSLRLDDDAAIEMSEREFATQAARHLGACSGAVEEIENIYESEAA